ncbi:hypothetical protein HZH66_012904 [Vespula vulgaris]|uniref:Uncharacterized protein n=1 Tax=Vespula vulgaris TaxID=7454 RepID=A0A834MTX4_VESVU|nr:hypothetical protein HZH66_012904 [Vespula vulgaris]
MLQESAIIEKEELTNIGQLIHWSLITELLSDITPDEVLSLFLKKKVMRLLVTKTNRHANQKSFQHPNSNKKMKTHYFRRNEKIYLTDDLNTDATNSMLVNGLHLKFSVFT